MTVEVDQLCGAPDDEKWDRICTKAAVERGNGNMMSPVLEVFYHHFEEDDGDDGEE